MNFNEYQVTEAAECQDCIDEGQLCLQHEPDALIPEPCSSCGTMVPFRDMVLCKKHLDDAPLCLTCAVKNIKVCPRCDQDYAPCCKSVISGFVDAAFPWLNEDDREVCRECYEEITDGEY